MLRFPYRHASHTEAGKKFTQTLSCAMTSLHHALKSLWLFLLQAFALLKALIKVCLAFIICFPVCAKPKIALLSASLIAFLLLRSIIQTIIKSTRVVFTALQGSKHRQRRYLQADDTIHPSATPPLLAPVLAFKRLYFVSRQLYLLCANELWAPAATCSGLPTDRKHLL